MNYYTSYYSNWRNFPDNTVQISISNSSPKSDSTLIRFPQVIPDWNNIVSPYKNGEITKDQFTKLYTQQLDDNLTIIKRAFEELSLITTDSGVNIENIVFLCYEKDADKCHRSIFANWVGDNLEIDIKEFK